MYIIVHGLAWAQSGGRLTVDALRHVIWIRICKDGSKPLNALPEQLQGRWGIAIAWCDLNGTILTCAVLLQCCTCDLCGCGSVFEFIFAAAGTAWCVVVTHHSDCTHHFIICKPESEFHEGLLYDRITAQCSQMNNIMCGGCRWAIAAIVLMKKSWAADDANVSQVTSLLLHLFHAGVATSEPWIVIKHDWSRM